MDWYNVHLVWPDKHYEKICVGALDKADAILDPKIYIAKTAGAYPYKVIGPLGIHKSTPKQMLAHKYRSCIGAARMLEVNVKAVDYIGHGVKVASARGLVDKQIAKVKRDIADMFKLMGLKIKHG